MECADVVLRWANEADKSERVQKIYVVFNLFRKDCIRLVFPSGAKVQDSFALLEGDYADRRRLAVFYSVKDVSSKEKALRGVIKKMP